MSRTSAMSSRGRGSERSVWGIEGQGTTCHDLPVEILWKNGASPVDDRTGRKKDPASRRGFQAATACGRALRDSLRLCERTTCTRMTLPFPRIRGPRNYCVFTLSAATNTPRPTVRRNHRRPALSHRSVCGCEQPLARANREGARAPDGDDAVLRHDARRRRRPVDQMADSGTSDGDTAGQFIIGS